MNSYPDPDITGRVPRYFARPTVKHHVILDKISILVVLVEKSIHGITKGVQSLFLHYLLSFYLLKSILDEATVDIKMIVQFGPNHHFKILSIKGNLLLALDQQNTF